MMMTWVFLPIACMDKSNSNKDSEGAKTTVIKPLAREQFAVLSPQDVLLSDNPREAKKLSEKVRDELIDAIKQRKKALHDKQVAEKKYQKAHTGFMAWLKRSEVPKPVFQEQPTELTILSNHEQQCSYFGIPEGLTGSTGILTWAMHADALHQFTEKVVEAVEHAMKEVSGRPLQLVSAGHCFGFSDAVIIAKILRKYPQAALQICHDGPTHYTCVNELEESIKNRINNQFSSWVQKCYPNNKSVTFHWVGDKGNSYEWSKITPDVVYARDNQSINSRPVGVRYTTLCNRLSRQNKKFMGIMIGVESEGITFHERGDLVQCKPQESPPDYQGQPSAKST